jgi:uncharacterized protein YndB with AHSA1/START domain
VPQLLEIHAERIIRATPHAIFEILATPARHHTFDGSDTVRQVRGGAPVLTMGASFRMQMKFGVPYIMKSTVVEFEQDRLIAWAHFGKHRWRYQLQPTNDGTLVRETFDWSTAIWPRGIEILKYPTRHLPNITETLDRLARVVE